MTLLTNNIGFDFGLVGDYSLGYELPFYQSSQYTVWEQKANTLLGGKSYITLGLYAFRITVFAEVIGAKFTSIMREKYDVVD